MKSKMEFLEMLMDNVIVSMKVEYLGMSEEEIMSALEIYCIKRRVEILEERQID